MAYQRGALKKRRLKAGVTWVLRYRVNRDDGKRIEKNFNVGLVRDFPREQDARREVDRLGVIARVNDEEADPRIRFSALGEHYLTNDCGPDALRPKTERTVLNTTHIVRAYLIPKWGKMTADDIKPLDIQAWLKELHSSQGLAWTTISKIRGTMLRIYRIGALHELVTKNPVLPVETRSTTAYRAILVTPQQTLAIIQSLPNPLHQIVVLTIAATALRASEALALRWADVLWEQARINVSKRWSLGKTAPPRPRSPKGTSPSTLPLPIT